MTEPTDAALAGRLKRAMRRLPGPVALVTSCEPDGSAPAGMVASSVIPVSMAPPAMLVAINTAARTHGVVSRSRRFCINLLDISQSGLVAPFADRALRDQRFEGDDWRYVDGLPVLTQSSAGILCRVEATLRFGTHELFVGAVDEVIDGAFPGGDPLGWLEGDFARLDRLA